MSVLGVIVGSILGTLSALAYSAITEKKHRDAFCKSCDLNDQRAFEARAMCEISQLRAIKFGSEIGRLGWRIHCLRKEIKRLRAAAEKPDKSE